MSNRKRPKRSTSTKPADATRRPSRNARSRIDPGRRAEAEKRALEGFKERTEEGHLLAGRTPPSQGTTPRTSGAHRSVDTSIRNAVVLTEDAKLLQQPGRRLEDFTQTDPW